MSINIEYVEYNNHKAVLTISKTLISNEAVLYCVNQQRHFFDITLSDLNSEKAQIILNFKGIGTDIKKSVHDFYSFLVDQQVRLDLENRFGTIRDKIIEAAFAPISKSTNNV